MDQASHRAIAVPTCHAVASVMRSEWVAAWFATLTRAAGLVFAGPWISSFRTGSYRTGSDGIERGPFMALRHSLFTTFSRVRAQAGTESGTPRPSLVVTQIKRYGGRLGHRDSRIGEKSW